MVRAVRIHELHKVRRERRSGFQTFINIYTAPSTLQKRSGQLAYRNSGDSTDILLCERIPDPGEEIALPHLPWLASPSTSLVSVRPR
jgi:hypothetical protein